MNHLAPFPIPPAKLLGDSIELIDEGSGPALLALHGGMGGYDQSYLLARALLPPGVKMRILAISRPGYLGTAQSFGTTPEHQADLYADLLNALKLDSVLVAGISAGGPSALQFALRHPSRCKGLVLVSAATGRLDMPDRFYKGLKSMQLMSHVPGLPGLLRHGVLGKVEENAARALKDNERARTTLAHPDAGPMFVAFQSGLFKNLNKRIPGTMNDATLLRTYRAPSYANLRLPVLALHGTDDDVVPLSHARAVANTTPGAKLVPLSGGGHFALFSHLDEVREAMRAFLTALT